MAYVNFGRSATTRGYNPTENILKPGHLIKLYGDYFMVDSVEPVSYTIKVTANGNTAGTEVGNGYDSGFFEDPDLEPYRNHLLCVVPSVYRQPKFIARDGSYNAVGFPNDTTELTLSAGLKTVGAAQRTHVGDISGKVYLQHPAGVPRWSVDEAPGDDKTGYIDASISPADDPNWNFAVWILPGENSLPQWRFLADAGETIYTPAIHLEGFKARIVKLSQGQVSQIQASNGGKLVYKLIAPFGLPTSGTMAADYSA